MNRTALAALALALVPAAARAQAPGQFNPNAFAPNMYNRQAQPLSPYLNLLRGGNTAVNYFYGVRPGTQPSAFTGMFNQSAIGPRQTFFPAVDTLADLTDDPQAAMRVAPTGHPVGFNNTLNYFGPTSGQVFARNAQQQGRRR
ncbi:MAG TPA: hypothetical protein VKD90_11290 [Gemmataceae bacterium]|nr:hypothetical protein [Gemmataceae bacterium]